MARDVAVVAFAQSPSVRRETSGNEVEMLMPILQEAKRQAGLRGPEIGSPSRAAATTSRVSRSPS